MRKALFASAMEPRQRLARWSGAALALIVVAACSSAEDGREPAIVHGGPGDVLGGVARVHPEIAALLVGAQHFPADRDEAGGFRVSAWSEPPAPPPWMKPTEAQAFVSGWKRTGAPVIAELPATADGPIAFRIPRGTCHVSVRRVGARPSSSGEPVAGAVVFKSAGRGVDAAVFSTEEAVEDLLVIREPGAEAGYRLELPKGCTARASRPGLIELKTAEGHAWLRLRADRAWDARGRVVNPTLELNGDSVTVRMPADAQYPVVVDPAWESTRNMAAPRAEHIALSLPSGNVLVAGGCTDVTDPEDHGKVTVCGAPLTSAELYNWRTNAFTLVQDAWLMRTGAGGAILKSGKALLVGGCAGDCAEATPEDPSLVRADAEVFDEETGLFTPTPNSMTEGRISPTVTALPDGRVLVIGGFRWGESGKYALATADLYDPETGLFSPAGTMATPRARHTATLLESGRVLVTGGESTEATTVDGGPPSEYPPSGSAEIWDPATPGHFTKVANQMTSPRCRHTATRIRDGRVLVAGGCSKGCKETDCQGVLTTTELFDPDTGQFMLADDMASPRRDHSAFLSPAGQVVVAGGCSAEWCGLTLTTVLNSYEVYDPSGSNGKGGFLEPQSTKGRRFRTAIAHLPSGRVLMAGGRGQGTSHASAEVHDPLQTEATYGATKALTSTMTSQRIAHTATLLGTGEVLIAGGNACTDSSNAKCMFGLKSAERFNPATEAFEPVSGQMSEGRLAHTATLLFDGRVLLAGGCRSPLCGQYGWSKMPSVSVTETAELYDPATGTFTKTAGNMHDARVGHTATLLPNGTVLVVAGCGDLFCTREDFPHLTSAELFDPATSTFTTVGTLEQKRGRHTATLLDNGEVAIVGGRDAMGTIEETELYTPLTQLFHVGRTPIQPRSHHGAVLEPNGGILLAGGVGMQSTTDLLSTAEHLDPTGSKPLTGFPSPMQVPRYWFVPGPVELPSEKTLLTGSCSSLEGCSAEQRRSTDIFEPLAFYQYGVFVPGAQMSKARMGHSVTRLSSGQVLLAGGCDIDPTKVNPNNQTTCETEVTDEAEVFSESKPSLAAAAGPRVVSCASPVIAGTQVQIQVTGLGFPTGGGAGLSHDSGAPAPIALWFPAVGGYPLAGRLTGWNDTQATWHVPTTARLGPGWLHVVMAGVPSAGFPVVIERMKDGQGCKVGPQCESGTCKDGVCCNSLCEGGCYGCTQERTGQPDGTCAPAMSTVACSTDDPNACGGGRCDGKGGCVPTLSCAPFKCKEDRSACSTQCASDLDCDLSGYCEFASSDASALCTNDRSGGQSCSRAAECREPLFCTNGKCCTQQDCAPFVCAPDGSKCLDSCGSDQECAPSNLCVTLAGKKTCVESGKPRCIDEVTAFTTQGARSCLPYRCDENGMCRVKCGYKSECADGYTCDRETGTCVPAGLPEVSDTGCKCHATGRSDNPWARYAAAAMLAALVIRRRPRPVTRR